MNALGPFPSSRARAAGSGRVFRLVYSSRAYMPTDIKTVSRLADEAAENNRKQDISGVLVSNERSFLQWLEGPAETVCGLMSRISNDKRHGGIELLSAGWVAERRFSDWAMHHRPAALAEPGFASTARSLGQSKPRASLNYAMSALDAAASDYRLAEPTSADRTAQAVALADALLLGAPGSFGSLNPRDLQARARMVDAVCKRFNQRWNDDTVDASALTIAALNLVQAWREAGEPSDPERARRCVAVVAPPGGSDSVGAVVTADVLRAAGIGVHSVIEDDEKRSLEAIAGPGLDAVLVAGPCLETGASARCADAFADTLRNARPGLPVYWTGCSSHALADWPDRFALQFQDMARLSAKNVEWSLLATLAEKPEPVSNWSSTLRRGWYH